MARTVARMPAEARMAVFVQDSGGAGDRYRLAACAGFPQLRSMNDDVPLVFSALEPREHIGRVAASRESICVADCRDDPLWALPDPAIASAYLVPVVLADAVIAVLGFFSEERGAFNSTASSLAERLAESFQHMAVAARRLQQLERAEARLATIVEIARGRDLHLDSAAITDAGALESLASGRSRATDGPPVDTVTRSQAHVSSSLASLSPRERQVLAAFRRQRRVSSISDTLQISPHTVRNHLKSIFQKLGVHSQVELLAAVGAMSPNEVEIGGNSDDLATV